jgi:hypothetical protein
VILARSHVRAVSRLAYRMRGRHLSPEVQAHHVSFGKHNASRITSEGAVPVRVEGLLQRVQRENVARFTIQGTERREAQTVGCMFKPESKQITGGH